MDLTRLAKFYHPDVLVYGVVSILETKQLLFLCIKFFLGYNSAIVGSITVDCTQGRLDPMSNAKTKGVRIGRPQMTKDDIPQMFYRHYPSYVSGELNVSELVRVCDMSRTRVYRYIKVLNNEKRAAYNGSRLYQLCLLFVTFKT